MKKYLGGRGLGSSLLYNSVPGNADPLCEENHLIFTYWSNQWDKFPVLLQTKSKSKY
jgi:hypothetical protein